MLAFFRIPEVTDTVELSLFQSMATGKLDSLRAAIGPISLNRFIDFILNCIVDTTSRHFQSGFLRQFRDNEQRQVLSPDSGPDGVHPPVLRQQDRRRARPEAQDQAQLHAGSGGDRRRWRKCYKIVVPIIGILVYCSAVE